jgi:PAS domain S-box-containing protein
MNKLLQRQINKFFGGIENIPEQYHGFLDLIDETYDGNDNDRKMLDRMMEITSEEMIRYHKKTETEIKEALMLSDSRLNLATKASNVGIWENNLLEKKLLWDDTTFKLHGIDVRGDITETEAWEMTVSPDVRIYSGKELSTAIVKRKDFDFEYKVTWPDSSVHYIRTKGVVQRNEKGRPVRIIGTKWDITDRRVAQENMLHEKELAESVISSLPVIFFLFNKEGKFIRWNKNLLDVSGYTEKEMETIHPLQFFRESEKEKMQNEIMKVLIQGQSDSEAGLLTKTGKVIPYYFNSISINYRGEECVIGTGTNIVERIRMEDNLRAKNKDLEEFAHIVSHNLRAPIAKIQGLTSLINKEEPYSVENIDLLEYIENEVINLDAIIKEMNLIIREKEYVNFTPSQPVEKALQPVKHKIYLIDDDPIVNIVSKKIIEKTEFAEKIEVFKDASLALQQLNKIFESDAKEFPDIIFLDINMPEMNGWEFLDRFEKLSEEIKQNCKVFMLTSSIDPSDVKKSQSYSSVKDFIIKPLSKEKLTNLNI